MTAIHKNNDYINKQDLYRKNYLQIAARLACIICTLFIISCQNRNDLNKIISDSWPRDSVTCIIDFSTCFDFTWDTMYYFSGKCSLEDIEKELGIKFDYYYDDVGDRVVFLYQGNIVYQQSWFYNPENKLEGVFFDTQERMFKVGKDRAKFRGEKSGNIFLLFFPYANFHTIKYENSIYAVTLTQQTDTRMNVELRNKATHLIKSYSAKLILIDGEVPEGSLRCDNNNPTRIEDYYNCDSTYSIDEESIRISFAQEYLTRKRLDFNIDESKIPDFKEGSYTLYKISE